MYSDGNFTDVSVVEIETNNKKPCPDDLKSLDLFKKEKVSTEGHSSGIGGSSCMSSSRPSISSTEEAGSAQNTASTVQYSTVVHSGYRHQVPSVQVFSRSESTQPLLDSEERPDELQLADHVDGSEEVLPRQQYFKQNCSQPEASPDISHFERSNQVSSGSEEDFVRLKQQQGSGHLSQPCGSEQRRLFQEGPAADALGPGTDGQVERFEPVGMETAMDEEIPKSYLPQTVRQGGYMPQWKTGPHSLSRSCEGELKSSSVTSVEKSASLLKIIMAPEVRVSRGISIPDVWDSPSRTKSQQTSPFRMSGTLLQALHELTSSSE